MTLPNPVLPDTDNFITRRTVDRTLLISPNPVINSIVRYALAYAAWVHGIRLYAYAHLSNHHHIVCHDAHGVQPDFCRDFHSLLARAVNRARDRSEGMWSAGRKNAIILWDPKSLFDKIVYTIANHCTSHLVDEPEDWPGVLSAIDDLGGPPRLVKKPGVFFDSLGPLPDTVELQFFKPDCFADWTVDEYRKEVARRVEEKCKEARRERRRRRISVLGRLEVLSQDPFAKPKTRAARGGKRPPHFACSVATLRVALLRWLRDFRACHRKARLAFDDGDREEPFPHGTYLHLRRYGVDCSALGPPPQ